jgi:hypothetical protein
MVKYGISYAALNDSVWYVVDAINCLKEFHISYPVDHEKQLQIAAKFCEGSEVEFDNCVGAIDGVLIWIHKPGQDVAIPVDLLDSGHHFGDVIVHLGNDGEEVAIPIEQGNNNAEDCILIQHLLHSGHHFADYPRDVRVVRTPLDDLDNGRLLPRALLLQKVVESHKVRPATNHMA